VTALKTEMHVIAIKKHVKAISLLLIKLFQLLFVKLLSDNKSIICFSKNESKIPINETAILPDNLINVYILDDFHDNDRQ